MFKSFFLFILLFSFSTINAKDFSEFKYPGAEKYIEIRNEILNSESFPAYFSYPDERDDLMKLLKERDESFLAKAEEWVLKYPFDIEILYYLSMESNLKMEYNKYAKYYFQYFANIAAILTSGDGKTCETAFTVLSVGEEYIIIRHLGLKPMGQSLSANGCDAMDCEDEEGKKVTLYFDVKPMMAKMQNLLSTPDNEDTEEE